MKLTNDEIFTKTRNVLATMLKIKPESIRQHSLLKDDLGVDSVEGLDMSYLLEDHFGIEINDKEVAELVTIENIINLIRRKIAK